MVKLKIIGFAILCYANVVHAMLPLQMRSISKRSPSFSRSLQFSRCQKKNFLPVAQHLPSTLSANKGEQKKVQPLNIAESGIGIPIGFAFIFMGINSEDSMLSTMGFLIITWDLWFEK